MCTCGSWLGHRESWLYHHRTLSPFGSDAGAKYSEEHSEKFEIMF